MPLALKSEGRARYTIRNWNGRSNKSSVGELLSKNHSADIIDSNKIVLRVMTILYEIIDSVEHLLRMLRSSVRGGGIVIPEVGGI
ncbi:hypothetical protein Tco_0915619 [Tanacetum coccineum]